MRVIAGSFKGKKLCEFKGNKIRPTADRTKESLFNIIKVEGKTFLDLFCGSGSIGIEAISRGAKKVTFTDVDKESVALAEKNLKSVKREEKVFCIDAKTFLSKAAEKFDYIFIDPPYATTLGVETLKIISERNLLNSGGTAVLETDKDEDFLIDGLTLTDKRKYGKARLYFFGAKV